MTHQPPPDDPSTASSAARRPRPAGGWLGPWGLLPLLLVALLGICGYWIVTLGGLRAAFADDQFRFWAIMALLVAVAVAMRIGVRRWQDGIVIDKRNDLATMRRSEWFRWRGRD